MYLHTVVMAPETALSIASSTITIELEKHISVVELKWSWEQDRGEVGRAQSWMCIIKVRSYLGGDREVASAGPTGARSGYVATSAAGDPAN